MGNNYTKTGIFLNSKGFFYSKMEGYDKDVLSKDCFIAIMAGIIGGLVVLFFSRVCFYLLKGNWVVFVIGFVMYIVIALISYIILRAFTIQTFGKKK